PTGCDADAATGTANAVAAGSSQRSEKAILDCCAAAAQACRASATTAVGGRSGTHGIQPEIHGIVTGPCTFRGSGPGRQIFHMIGGSLSGMRPNVPGTSGSASTGCGART